MKTIEIITNTQCFNNCPNCNQADFMREEPGYSYTIENAKNLIKVITEAGREKEFDLVLSGGEPLLHPFIIPVLRTLKESGVFNTISLTTSYLCPKIELILEYVDNLYFSWRNPEVSVPALLQNPKVKIWDTLLHVDFPETEYTGEGYCCCTHVGVCCCIIGETVFPCTLAKELQYRGVWKSPSASLYDYFNDKIKLPTIGTYKACKLCPNNQGWRNKALVEGKVKRTAK